MVHRIGVVVHRGFTDSGVSIALDVFHTANSLRARAGRSPLFAVEVLSAKGGSVRGASGLTSVSTRALGRMKSASVVIVPGFWAEDGAEVDAVLADAETRALVQGIATAHRRGALLASSCAGAFMLAQAGLLDGKQATTAWWLAQHLQLRWPSIDVVAEAALVVADRVMTAGAAFAQADIALNLVTRYGGPSLARLCSNLLLLDRHASQTPYMALRHLALNDPVLLRAEKWARANLASGFDIPQLAKRLGVTPRTLARKLERSLGMSPIAFVQQLRVEAAVQLLETTDWSLDRISEQVGYADPHTLSRLIHRELQVSPRELRRKKRAA